MDMAVRLDPVRMAEYADHWHRVLDDAWGVFTRLETQLTGHLQQSWHGQAGVRALEVLRRYISESLDGLAGCRSLAGGLAALSSSAGDLRAALSGLDHALEHTNALAEVRVRYSDPAVAAGNAVDDIPSPPGLPGDNGPASTPVPAPAPTPAPTPVFAGSAPTIPAGYGATQVSAPLPPAGNESPSWATPPSPALRRNIFDDYGVISPTHTAGTTPPGLTAAVRDAEGRLPAAAASNTATVPPSAPAAPARPVGDAQPRGGPAYAPLMGAAYPGGVGRDDGSTHRMPGYLVSLDNGNELIGPLPKVAPPVLGDWPNIDPRSDSW
jgi:hypothetical protein